MEITLNIDGVERRLSVYPDERKGKITEKLRQQAESINHHPNEAFEPGATLVAMAEENHEPVTTIGMGDAKVDLPAGALTIGRSLECDICIEDLQVSRTHATLTVHASDGRVKLRDLESANGTFVNGNRIIERILSVGDVIQVGQTKLVFG